VVGNALAVGLLAAAGGVPWLIAGAMAFLAIASIVALSGLPETAGIDLTPIHEASPAGT